MAIITHPAFPFCIKEIKELKKSGYEALLNCEALNLIMSGTCPNLLTINYLLEKLGILNHSVPTGIPVVPQSHELEGSESIHKFETHQSAARSLRELDKLYSQNLDEEGYLQNLHNLYTWIEELPSDDAQNDIAKRAIQRLTTTFYGNYKDPISKISITRALLLTWIAIHDKSQRVDSSDAGLANAKQRFIEALVGIEYKDHHSATVQVSQEEPLPACYMSIHNRLAMALDSVHKAVSIVYVTDKQKTNLSFQKIVKADTQSYLAKLLRDLKNPDDLKAICKDIEQNDFDNIYKNIKQAVAEQLFTMHQDYFISPDNPELTALVNNGHYVDVKESLTKFKQAAEAKLAEYSRSPVLTSLSVTDSESITAQTFTQRRFHRT